MCQSLYAEIIATVISSLKWLRWPALNPVKVGKHIEARIPLRFMSRTRSWTSYTPGRISAKPAGSRPHSSGGQDTTALSPLTPVGRPR